MIERADPFNFEWLGFSCRNHLQIGKRPMAFCVEQPVYDQVKCASDWKRLSREMEGFHTQIVYGDYTREVGYALKMTGEAYLSIVAPGREPKLFDRPANDACQSCHSVHDPKSVKLLKYWSKGPLDWLTRIRCLKLPIHIGRRGTEDRSYTVVVVPLLKAWVRKVIWSSNVREAYHQLHNVISTVAATIYPTRVDG